MHSLNILYCDYETDHFDYVQIMHNFHVGVVFVCLSAILCRHFHWSVAILHIVHICTLIYIHTTHTNVPTVMFAMYKNSWSLHMYAMWRTETSSSFMFCYNYTHMRVYNSISTNAQATRIATLWRSSAIHADSWEWVTGSTSIHISSLDVFECLVFFCVISTSQNAHEAHDANISYVIYAMSIWSWCVVFGIHDNLTTIAFYVLRQSIPMTWWNQHSRLYPSVIDW